MGIRVVLEAVAVNIKPKVEGLHQAVPGVMENLATCFQTLCDVSSCSLLLCCKQTDVPTKVYLWCYSAPAIDTETPVLAIHSHIHDAECDVQKWYRCDLHIPPGPPPPTSLHCTSPLSTIIPSCTTAHLTLLKHRLTTAAMPFVPLFPIAPFIPGLSRTFSWSLWMMPSSSTFISALGSQIISSSSSCR